VIESSFDKIIATAALDEGGGLRYKIRKDPRVTTAGPWLRPRHVENWSPALEVQILGKTCAAVVKGREAY
jgi:lipopolysaccharide/colanic/teichoic acid biosynthesis glycosyltransferase